MTPELESFIRSKTSPNRADSFVAAARKAIDNGTKNIIETGCFRGTRSDGCSTAVLAAVAKELGTSLHSYELEAANIECAKGLLREVDLESYVVFHQGDSITNLANRTEPIGFAYFDSFDLGVKSHRQSQEHQLAELQASLPLLEQKSVILMDDHNEVLGGKTKLSIQRLDQLRFEKLHQGLQVLYSSNNSQLKPSARFAVLCAHTDGYTPMAVRTVYRNRALYCLEHGYDLVVSRNIRKEYADPNIYAGGLSWSRLADLLELLESGKNEWVWVTGCDLLITNMRTRLEAIVGQVGPKKHVIASGEHVAQLQADSFLVRSSKQGIGWVRDHLACFPSYKTQKWVENQAMIDFLPKYRPVVDIVPQNWINSFQYNSHYWEGHDPLGYASGLDRDGNRGEWRDGDFVIHWAGTDMPRRMELLNQYETKIVKPAHLIYLVYTRVCKSVATDPSTGPYDVGAKKFLDTFLQFPPNYPHQLIIINCNGEPKDDLFGAVASRCIRYDGGGWDCGAYVDAAQKLDCDLMICFNSRTYFHRKDWIQPFINALDEYGPGIYSPSASREVRPHLRTPCIAFTPEIVRRYPIQVNDRGACCKFEHSDGNIAEWAIASGYPALMVNPTGLYPRDKWREGENIFRRGDQSNVVVFDRHTDGYSSASESDKKLLGRMADGG